MVLNEKLVTERRRDHAESFILVKVVATAVIMSRFETAASTP